MMDSSKKLVRGLKDISALFDAEPSENVAIPPRELQILGVSSPHYDGDSFFLNAFLAAQFAGSGKPRSLISVLSRHSKTDRPVYEDGAESFGDHFQRYSVYWDELLHHIEPTAFSKQRPLQSRDIFLDFERQHLLYSREVIQLLDKWILVMRPTVESLTEGYKMIKAGFAMNPEVEFFVILEGKAQETQGRVVHERFSDFVTRHLGVSLNWLGWVDFSDPNHQFSSGLHMDQLFYQPWQSRLSLEKFALASWIESVEQKSKKGLLAEVLK